MEREMKKNCGGRPVRYAYPGSVSQFSRFSQFSFGFRFTVPHPSKTVISEGPNQSLELSWLSDGISSSQLLSCLLLRHLYLRKPETQKSAVLTDPVWESLMPRTVLDVIAVLFQNLVAAILYEVIHT